jgi:hypothetical protein
LTAGDKPEQDVVIAKSGEIPIEEPYRNELWLVYTMAGCIIFAIVVGFVIRYGSPRFNSYEKLEKRDLTE